jgi:hypothetical protein
MLFCIGAIPPEVFVDIEARLYLGGGALSMARSTGSAIDCWFSSNESDKLPLKTRLKGVAVTVVTSGVGESTCRLLYVGTISGETAVLPGPGTEVWTKPDGLVAAPEVLNRTTLIIQ